MYAKKKDPLYFMLCGTSRGSWRGPWYCIVNLATVTGRPCPRAGPWPALVPLTPAWPCPRAGAAHGMHQTAPFNGPHVAKRARAVNALCGLHGAVHVACISQRMGCQEATCRRVAHINAPCATIGPHAIDIVLPIVFDLSHQ